MGTAPDDTRRRRVGLALIALALLLFVGEMVAIVLGQIEVAGLIFLVFAAGWFVLRSYQKRTGRV
jgi:membrane-bound ClpP family serine protease